MYCTHCGHKIEGKAVYCPYCGKKVGSVGSGNDNGKQQKNNQNHNIIIILSVILGVLLISLMVVTGIKRIGSSTNQGYKRDEDLLTEDSTGSLCVDLEELNLSAKDADEVLEALDSVKALIGMENPKEELAQVSVNSFDGDTFYRFEQTYNGLPVIGKGVVAKTNEEGTLDCLTCKTLKIAGINTEPALSEQDVRRILNEESDSEADDAELSLCIYIDESENAVLAYKAKADFCNYVIDANNGSVLEYSDGIYTAREKVRLKGQSVERDVEIEKEGTHYQLYDSVRNIRAFDSTNVPTNLSLTDVCLSSRFIVFDEGGSLPSGSAIDAVYNVQKSYDFWYAELGRKSTDGEGKARIEIFDHLEGCLKNNKVDPWVDNAAAWSRPNDLFSGVLIGPRSEKDQNTYSEDLEVIAHEYTHAVLGFIVDLDNDEGKAINEALADIMGEMTHAYYDNGKCDWKNALRDMVFPANSIEDGVHFDNYAQYDKKKNEHNNSTILSHTAYLMWDAPNAATGIEPIKDYKKMSYLWYQTMLLLCDRPSFKDVRTACEMAAYKMMKKEMLISPEFNCVVWAFDQCGIGYFPSDFREDWASGQRGFKILVNDYAGKSTSDYNIIIESSNGTRVFQGNGEDAANKEFDLPQGFYSIYISSPHKGFSDYRIIKGSYNSGNKIPPLLDWRDNKNIVKVNTNYGTGIQGLVNDDNGKPVRGVLITARKSINDTNKSMDDELWETISDENGQFSMHLPNGSYSITAEENGYQSAELKVDVSNDFSEVPKIIINRLSASSEKAENESKERSTPVSLDGMKEPIYVFTMSNHFSEANGVDLSQDSKQFWKMVALYATGKAYEERDKAGEKTAELYTDEDTGWLCAKISDGAVKDLIDTVLPGVTTYPDLPVYEDQIYKHKGGYYYLQITEYERDSCRIKRSVQKEDGNVEALVEVFAVQEERVYALYKLDLKKTNKANTGAADPFDYCITNAVLIDEPSKEYEELISTYCSAIDDIALYEQDPGEFTNKYPLINPNIIRQMHSNVSMVMCSSYKDINGDGEYELLLMTKESDWQVDWHTIGAIYTRHDKKIIPLINDVNETSSITVFTDGTIVVSGQGEYGEETIYKISENGQSLDIIEQFETDWENHPDLPYSDGKNRMSYEQYEDKYINGKEEQDFKWIQQAEVEVEQTAASQYNPASGILGEWVSATGYKKFMFTNSPRTGALPNAAGYVEYWDLERADYMKGDYRLEGGEIVIHFINRNGLRHYTYNLDPSSASLKVDDTAYYYIGDTRQAESQLPGVWSNGAETLTFYGETNQYVLDRNSGSDLNGNYTVWDATHLAVNNDISDYGGMWLVEFSISGNTIQFGDATYYR